MKKIKTIKTVREFIAAHERKNPRSLFFSKEWLKAFGESLSQMNLYTCGNNFVVASYQKNSPFPSKFAYHVFDSDTLEHIDSAHGLSEFITKYGQLKEV